MFFFLPFALGVNYILSWLQPMRLRTLDQKVGRCCAHLDAITLSCTFHSGSSVDSLVKEGEGENIHRCCSLLKGDLSGDRSTYITEELETSVVATQNASGYGPRMQSNSESERRSIRTLKRERKRIMSKSKHSN